MAKKQERHEMYSITKDEKGGLTRKRVGFRFRGVEFKSAKVDPEGNTTPLNEKESLHGEKKFYYVGYMPKPSQNREPDIGTYAATDIADAVSFANKRTKKGDVVLAAEVQHPKSISRMGFSDGISSSLAAAYRQQLATSGIEHKKTKKGAGALVGVEGTFKRFKK
tara:strand:- start:3574 stop:4068 length:495 start_codon:yes stop_codon:yes gene_type:complete